MTEHARYLLPTARKIVELMDNCETYFTSGQDTDYKLHAIFTRGIIEEFADVTIAEFRRRHPKIYIEIKQGQDMDCEDALDALEAEVALTAGPLDTEKYSAEFIHSSRYGIVVHKDDPLARLRSLNISELDGRPLTMMRERQKTYSVIKAAAENAGVRLNISSWVDDALLTCQYADLKQSMGITTSSHHLFTGTNLCFVPFDDPTISWNVYLVTLKDIELSPAAELFMQLIRRHRDNRLMDRKLGVEY